MGKKLERHQRQSGVILLIVLVTVVFMTLASLTFMSLMQVEEQASQNTLPIRASITRVCFYRPLVKTFIRKVAFGITPLSSKQFRLQSIVDERRRYSRRLPIRIG